MPPTAYDLILEDLRARYQPTFRRGDEDLIPRIREVMRARHVDGTLPMLPRSNDPYESNERVRTELMLLTGYFHTESSHHASEYWAWFRKTPALTREYLDRRWDYLEVCRSSDAGDSNADSDTPPAPRIKLLRVIEPADRKPGLSNVMICLLVPTR